MLSFLRKSRCLSSFSGIPCACGNICKLSQYVVSGRIDRHLHSAAEEGGTAVRGEDITRREQVGRGPVEGGSTEAG